MCNSCRAGCDGDDEIFFVFHALLFFFAFFIMCINDIQNGFRRIRFHKLPAHFFSHKDGRKAGKCLKVGIVRTFRGSNHEE
ncbi:Uncharacterised protein [Mycobacteroides abscessus subsp. abscessus]|nr:Uncharacterised protein [Mycobacteroides abscessus subsp. abscessus]